MKEKLVRDLIPSTLASQKVFRHHREAAERERHGLLQDKLVEEVMEYLEKPELEELADILEVVYALVKLHGLSPAGLEAVRAKKARQRGAFDRFLVMEITE